MSHFRVWYGLAAKENAIALFSWSLTGKMRSLRPILNTQFTDFVKCVSVIAFWQDEEM
ncbi:hypothetical protein NDI37_10165 [Funiculus sociatus GB2-A5]|uniref:Uncharacterized protein n=1 Tax=Funiculus sociatus GB2-A5 TaxID=2933946 RepID=A0ABV0JN57_9CYAN|nr:MULTISPECIES: hypothetical protein [unclassified Trichocoleus]MBD1907859.1 hypothetical protein [Trichocoleus sp. FACHB-832]MBD2064037.1 hypothetical protein [Trichocoleus sp. FACHB-6]